MRIQVKRLFSQCAPAKDVTRSSLASELCLMIVATREVAAVVVVVAAVAVLVGEGVGVRVGEAAAAVAVAVVVALVVAV